MIRAGKYSVFEGSVFNKLKHDVPSISSSLLLRLILTIPVQSAAARGLDTTL